jgi:dihydrofolate synthase/folylpolyglutamate synthase
VREVIARDVRARGGEVTFIDDISEVGNTNVDKAGMYFDLRIEDRIYTGLFAPLQGTHQLENAALALAAVNALQGKPTDEADVRAGFQSLRLFGRTMVVREHPPIILDGAINAESAGSAIQLGRRLSGTDNLAVVAVPKPKDLDGVCREVCEIAKQIIVTEVDTPTLEWYPNADAIARRYCPSVIRIPEFVAAMERASEWTDRGQGVLLLGTQSFVGAALEYFDVETCVIYDAESIAESGGNVS